MVKKEKTGKELLLMTVLVQVTANIIEIVLEEHPEIVARAVAKLIEPRLGDAKIEETKETDN